MAKALYITVLESCKTLKSLLRTAKSWERPRLIMLLEMQKAGEASITKESLMQRVGVCGYCRYCKDTIFSNTKCRFFKKNRFFLSFSLSRRKISVR